MVLEFTEFTKAADDVESIIKLSDNADLKSEILKSAEYIPREKRREYLRHMNSLFLNILLNRLNEFGQSVEVKIIKARKILVDLINNQ